MKAWPNDYGDIPRWWWLIRPRFPRHPHPGAVALRLVTMLQR